MRVVCVSSLLFYSWGRHVQTGKEKKLSKVSQPANSFTDCSSRFTNFQYLNKWFLMLHFIPKLSLFGRFTIEHFWFIISLPLSSVAV